MQTKKITNSHRRAIRKLIREEFKKQQILQEKVNAVETKMLLFENAGKTRGLTQEQINEGLMTIINEDLGDVGFDMIKRYLAGKLLNFLGIDQASDPILFTFFQNVLEAINYTQLYKYFGSNKCEEIMSMVTEATVETVTEMGGEKVISYLAGKFLPSGVAGSVQGALDSSLANVSQEAINEVVVALVRGYLQEPMREYICEGKLMDAVKGLFSGAGGGSIISDILGKGLEGLGNFFDVGNVGKMAAGAIAEE
tara:strand:+ start:1053 stop:1811 length:759 start_codon:yes stop_codon:yes gene_type:complete